MAGATPAPSLQTSAPRSPRAQLTASGAQPGSPPFKVLKSEGGPLSFATEGAGQLWPTSPLTPLDRSASVTSESSSDVATQQFRNLPARLNGGFAPSTVDHSTFDSLCPSFDRTNDFESAADALLVARTSSEIEHWLLEEEQPAQFPNSTSWVSSGPDASSSGWLPPAQPSPVSTLPTVDETRVLSNVEKDPWGGPAPVSLAVPSGPQQPPWNDMSGSVPPSYIRSPASSNPSSPELEHPSFSFLPPGPQQSADIHNPNMNWSGLSGCEQCSKPGSLSARCLGCGKASVACLECAAGREARGFAPGTYFCPLCLKRPVREMPKEQLEKLCEQLSRGKAFQQLSKSAPASPRLGPNFPVSPNAQPSLQSSWDDMFLGSVPTLNLQFPSSTSPVDTSSAKSPSWKRKHAKWRGKHSSGDAGHAKSST